VCECIRRADVLGLTRQVPDDEIDDAMLERRMFMAPRRERCA
jgi:hypothetical protein